MGAIMNGMVLHGGIRPYGGTFLVFSDYMRPAIRLAALMEQPVTYIFTHDSDRAGRRRPDPSADRAARRAARDSQPDRHPPRRRGGDRGWPGERRWSTAAGPTALVLTRQKLPVPDRAGIGLGGQAALRGGYVLAIRRPRPGRSSWPPAPSLHLALDAADQLGAEGIPVAGGVPAVVGVLPAPAGGLPRPGAAAVDSGPGVDRGPVTAGMARVDHR